MTNGNLKCAFCRQEPHVSVFNKHNRKLRAVQTIPKEWDYKLALCLVCQMCKCDVIKQCIERNLCKGDRMGPFECPGLCLRGMQ